MPRVSEAYVEARRREILGAAQRRFAEAGYRGTRMADVAREAGLSTGALYRYFDSKEALVRGLAEEGRAVGRRIREAALAATGEEPYEGLLALIRGYLERVGPGTDPVLRLSVQLWGEAVREELLGAEVRRSYEELLAAVTERVRVCQEAGELSGERDAREVGRAIVALLNEVGLQRALGMEVGLEEYGRTVEALLEGLRP